MSCGDTELLNEIRLRLGSPSPTVVSNEALELAVSLALAEVSRVAPVTSYVPLDLSTGEQEYAVADEDVLKVTGFWMSIPSSFSLGSEFEGFHSRLGTMEYAEMAVFHSPSLMTILEQKWEQWFHRYGYSWEWDEGARLIRVIPAPRSAGKAVYKVTKARSLGDVAPHQMKPFKDLVYAEALDVSSNTGGGAVTSIPIGIGNVSFDRRSMSAKSESLRKDALKRLRSQGGSVVIG